MTREEFDKLVKECGFKTYVELARTLDVASETIVVWNRNENYPSYLKQALIWYKEAKNVGEINLDDENLDEKIKNLELENSFLTKELEYLQSLKETIKRKIQHS